MRWLQLVRLVSRRLSAVNALADDTEKLHLARPHVWFWPMQMKLILASRGGLTIL
jgi:hypothetical protein